MTVFLSRNLLPLSAPISFSTVTVERGDWWHCRWSERDAGTLSEYIRDGKPSKLRGPHTLTPSKGWDSSSMSPAFVIRTSSRQRPQGAFQVVCVCVPCYYLRVYFLIMNVCLGTSLRRLKDLENSVPNRGPLIQYVHNFIHIWIHVSYIQIYATNLYTVYMLR